jgi:hypothetical protein
MLSFRGPRRALIGGGLLLFVGVASSLAAFVMFQTQGAPGSVADVGIPIVNRVLEANGSEPISQPADDGSSGILVAVFVLGALAAAVGLFLLIVGAVWTVVWGTRRGHAVVAPVVTSAAQASAGRYRRLRKPAPDRALPRSGPLAPAPGSLTAGDPLEESP